MYRYTLNAKKRKKVYGIQDFFSKKKEPLEIRYKKKGRLVDDKGRYIKA
jgi:hypothetical protein